VAGGELGLWDAEVGFHLSGFQLLVHAIKSRKIGNFVDVWHAAEGRQAARRGGRKAATLLA
jgi:hypothetical protein